MKTKQLVSIAFLYLASALVAVQAQPTVPKIGSAARPVPSAPQLGANSYILTDFHSGRVLVEHNADLRVEPASITKLMTAYVVFSELAQGNINLDDLVPVSERAWKTGGSRMFIEPGMEVTAEQLIRGMVIQSGNDASVALAEFVAGSEEAFAALMNHFAEQLGMQDTNFRNATGLPDPDHYTTARDIVTLSAATVRGFSRLLRLVRGKGIHLQQYPPAQPQYAVVARPCHRWIEDRPHRGSRLLPGLFGHA